MQLEKLAVTVGRVHHPHFYQSHTATLITLTASVRRRFPQLKACIDLAFSGQRTSMHWCMLTSRICSEAKYRNPAAGLHLPTEKRMHLFEIAPAFKFTGKRQFGGAIRLVLAAVMLAPAIGIGQSLPVEPDLPNLMIATTSCVSRALFLGNGGTVFAACDGSNSSPDGSVLTGHAQAEVTPTGSSAFVKVNALGTYTSPNTTIGQQFFISADAGATIFFSISPFTPPPASVAYIPIALTMKAEFEIEGEADGVAAAFANGVGIFSFDTSSNPPQLNFEETRTEFFVPGEINNLTKAIHCSAGPHSLLSNTASCSGIADPILAFDQARFDTIMGSATFPLADYYTIRVSANLVPEPETYALVLVGLFVVAGFARREQQPG